jgi:hypothetical protein
MDKKNRTPESAAPRAPRTGRPAPRGAGPARLRDKGEARKLVQELQLHKIELEMQNDELRQVQEDLQVARRLVDQRVVARTAELTQAITRLAEELQLRYQSELALRNALADAEAAKERLEADLSRLRYAE